jgi:hypothetical protein
MCSVLMIYVFHSNFDFDTFHNKLKLDKERMKIALE